MPWAKAIMPAPKLLTSLPLASNLSTGSSGDILPDASAHLFSPQRSPTQIDMPSLSTSTALVEPHLRPSGSFNGSLIVSEGLGRSFVGAALCCAKAAAPARTASTNEELSFISLLRASRVGHETTKARKTNQVSCFRVFVVERNGCYFLR